VSMQTVLNYCDEGNQSTDKKMNSTPNHFTNNHSTKPRLSSESAREIDRGDKVKRMKETNPIATLPRHSAAVNAIGSEERNFRNDSTASFRSANDNKSSAAQSVLELDVLPS